MLLYPSKGNLVAHQMTCKGEGPVLSTWNQWNQMGPEIQKKGQKSQWKTCDSGRRGRRLFVLCNCWKIALQCCVGFCCTKMHVSHNYIYIPSLLSLPSLPVTPFIPPPLGHKWFWEYRDLIHDRCFETGENRSRDNCQTVSDRHPGNRDHSPTAARQRHLPAIQMSKGMNSPQRNPQREAVLLNLEVSLIVKLLNCRIIK